MTDSMKFGPEWLRNLSAESLSNSGLGASNMQTGNGMQNSSATPKNMFPEFRYGREEMLSLFDKNCNIPEILPRYKRLFIEKVQFPLAMTPCTEDELPITAPVLNTGRPAWLQRSPVGFSSSMRGIARGGSVDRGRLRGKPVYHTGFQRPTPTYEDETRPIPPKVERSWSERNGEQMLNSSMSMDWNGTGLTSPRREYPSHSRNLENWRRNRSDDVANDTPPPSSIGNSSNEGWRGNSFGSSTRWGRSTSWREEDVSNDSGGFVAIQRSYSTHPSERSYMSGMSNSTGKKYESHSNVNNIPGPHSNAPRGSDWTHTHGGNHSSGDFDENLPEWATENATDVGGTFDATGAFHDISQSDEQKKTETNTSTPDRKSTVEPVSENVTAADLKSNDVHSESPKQALSTVESNPTKVEPKHTEENEKVPPAQSKHEAQTSNAHSERERRKLPESTENETELSTGKPEAITDLRGEQKPLNVDISDKINEVTNNIEKLIMDDDGGINNNMNAGTGDKAFQGNAFKQLSTEAETLSPLQTAHNNVRAKQPAMYLPDGRVGNHTQLQNQQSVNELAQQHAQLIASTTPGANELWYYRDPQLKVQGPFSAIEMTEWYRAGYFNENLFVRRVCDLRFRPLGELITICNGHIPFTHSHMLPMDLENLPMNNPLLYNDFGMPNMPQKNDQCDELKGNVTAAANSLSHAVKNVMNSVDTTHILNMHFQMLQEQYIRHQEIMIVAELSKNECFQQLTAHEKDAYVRQKVQMLILPDYLSSLTGLRNSLAILNPAVGNQLYDAIAQCSKKVVNQFPSGGQSPHTQQLNANSPSNPTDDLARNVALQTQAHNSMKFNPLQYSPINDCEMVNKLPPDTETISGNNMLNEYNLRMMLTGGHINNLSRPPQNKMPDFIVPNDVAANRPELPVEQQLSTPSEQSPLIHMWIPTNNNNQQLPMVNTLPLSNQSNNSQWVDSLLVGMSNTNLEAPLDTPNCMPQSIWNAVVPENVAEAQAEQKYPKADNEQVTSEEQEKLNASGEPNQPPADKQAKDNNVAKDQQQYVSAETKTSSPAAQASRQEKAVAQNNAIKKIKSSITASAKAKEESAAMRKTQAIEEERRRETAEDKRKVKEDRKRQQVEEEKRRQQALEEEKKRQQLEEKERQQLIQAQRRKALMANAANGNTENASNSKTAKETISSSRVQSSIAPWSLQTTTATTNSGPGLAEIQKAERRERRADQQRQTELSIAKATASAINETNEQVLKWNAAPVPVKSFAEIQAEEAKRLAAEQIELQRRKEQEQLTLTAAAAAANNMANNVNNIWAANKVWHAQTPNSIWEDGAKYTGSTGSTVSATGSSAHLNAHQSGLATASGNTQQTQASANRNLRKSQTVSVMQTTAGKSAANDKNAGNGTNKKLQARTDNTESKKSAPKKQQQSTAAQSHNSRDEFEREFTMWCTKSLSGMNTIVDVPTFVSFLQDLESPYEVKDYIRMYLGDNKETIDFGKQFLERRSKYKNLQRAQNAHNDDMCKPAPALTPSGNDHSDSKGKQKKVKKNKMTKLDARILGFSVTAAEGRINVGDRDYVDAP